MAQDSDRDEDGRLYEPWERAAEFVGDADDAMDDVTWRGAGAHPELPPGLIYGPEYRLYLEKAEREDREARDEALRDLLGNGPIITDPDDSC